jgi:hypothetical protein
MYHDPPILTSCKNVVPQKLHKSSVFGPMEFSQTLAPQVSKSNWFNHVYCEPPMFLGEIPIFGESSSINIDPGIELCFFDELKLPIVDRRVSPCISPTPKAPPYPLVKMLSAAAPHPRRSAAPRPPSVTEHGSRRWPGDTRRAGASRPPGRSLLRCGEKMNIFSIFFWDFGIFGIEIDLRLNGIGNVFFFQVYVG